MMCNIELPEIRNQWETTNPWGSKLVQGSIPSDRFLEKAQKILWQE